MNIAIPRPLIFSAIAIEISCLAFSMLGNLRQNIPIFLAFYFFAFAAYALSIPVWTGKLGRENPSRFPAVFCTACALAFRLTLLFAEPSLSDDIYRYMWDGRVQSHGLNPYSHPPEAKELELLRDKYYEGVNHKEVRTIYPPFAQVFFCSWTAFPVPLFFSRLPLPRLISAQGSSFSFS
ncbi:MAG: hypothetical protein HZA01_06415 [Nitrospinae bacterium]|nr:hypothetical protein [Nitrospinota bacterium]